MDWNGLAIEFIQWQLSRHRTTLSFSTLPSIITNNADRKLHERYLDMMSIGYTKHRYFLQSFSLSEQIPWLGLYTWTFVRFFVITLACASCLSIGSTSNIWFTLLCLTAMWRGCKPSLFIVPSTKFAITSI